MNKLITKIACAGIALTLIAGAFTGCKSEKTKANNTAALPSYTSVKDPDGSLAQQGKIGDTEYKILSKESYGCYNKDRGYYIDQLEQLDSPYFIVITSGSKTVDGHDINIVDLGMQGSTIVIVVEEIDNAGTTFQSPEAPCCVLEVDHDHYPTELLIVNTNGEVFNQISA